MSLAQLIMHKMCLTWPKLSFLPTIFEFLQWPSLSGVNHQMLHHHNGWMTLTRWMTSCHHPRVVILVSSSPASTLRWLSSRNDRQKKTSVVVGPRGSSQPTVTNDSCPFGLRTNDPLVAGQKRPTRTNDNQCFLCLPFRLLKWVWDPLLVEQNTCNTSFTKVWRHSAARTTACQKTADRLQTEHTSSILETQDQPFTEALFIHLYDIYFLQILLIFFRKFQLFDSVKFEEPNFWRTQLSA